MKQIYIVGKTYKNQTGGPANVIRGLSSALKNRNVNVQVICLSESFKKSALIRCLLKILFVKRNCIVNVHTDGLKLPKLVYVFSRIDKKNQYFLTVHGLYYIESRMNGTYSNKYAKIERLLITKFPNLICVSDLLRKRIELDFGRTKNVGTVLNGIDFIENKTLETRKVCFETPLKLLMLGGVRERKGIFDCIKVVDYLQANGIDAKLSVYGVVDSQETYEKFNSRIEELKLNEKIIYKGNLSDKESVYRVIRESDIHLSLSKWDTFNVAIIESLAMGVPCIASDQCGASNAIHQGINGIIVDMKSDEWLKIVKDFCVRLINQKIEENTQIMELASVIRQKYDWDRIVEEYLKQLQFRELGNE